MGGCVGVTLITPVGTTYKMNRWTNSLPFFVNSLKLINKDQEHIDEYLKSWLEMKEDWEKNGPNGPFEHNMTDVYFPHDTLSPVEYGMVVIDMQKDRIYSSQGYCSVGRASKINRTPKPWDDYWNDKNNVYTELESAGRLRLIEEISDDLFIESEIDMSPFIVKDYGVGFDAISTMFEDMKGEYNLSEEEKSLWEEFINYYREEEDYEEA